MNAQATITTSNLSPRVRRSKRAFLRHFVEMLLAMFLGMGVLGGLAALAFSAAGGSISDASGAARVLIMGFSMTAPMVAWMGYRGHERARSAEMAASMIVPSLAAAGLAAAGMFAAEGALALQHVAMVPAMLGVMLWRYDHYAGGHGHAGSRS